MSTSVVRRMPTWPTFVWSGVIGSVLAWTWVWSMGRLPSAVMVFVALAAVALVFPARAGMRWAFVGLMVAGLAMFLSSLYSLYLLVFGAGGPVHTLDWVAAFFLPMVAATLLLLGAATGFRHAGTR
jgi:predicted neutral ceramidase superfamily lipid hydrolase